jgi:hypothetical protein
MGELSHIMTLCTQISVIYLQCNGMDISWSHLCELYTMDNDSNREAPGLRVIPKLKYEHIHLTSFSKMRVDLAAQVSQIAFIDT